MMDGKQDRHGPQASRAEQLQRIVALSQQMLEMARSGEWVLVGELESQRKQLVIACFQRPPTAEDAVVTGSIRIILDLNQQIAELGRSCQERLIGEIRARSVGRAAAAAYINHSP